MSNRISETVLLCEDDSQARLVRAYLRKCNLPSSEPQLRVRNASRQEHGGNVAWVMKNFPTELEACRKRNRLTRTALIVVIDADSYTVAQRREQLQKQCARSTEDVLVLLIPKRHIETWIRNALGDSVNEEQDCKSTLPKKGDIRRAAGPIHGWARNDPEPPETCVESLRAALPEWRKIG